MPTVTSGAAVQRLADTVVRRHGGPRLAVRADGDAVRRNPLGDQRQGQGLGPAVRQFGVVGGGTGAVGETVDQDAHAASLLGRLGDGRHGIAVLSADGGAVEVEIEGEADRVRHRRGARIDGRGRGRLAGGLLHHGDFALDGADRRPGSRRGSARCPRSASFLPAARPSSRSGPGRGLSGRATCRPPPASSAETRRERAAVNAPTSATGSRQSARRSGSVALPAVASSALVPKWTASGQSYMSSASTSANSLYSRPNAAVKPLPFGLGLAQGVVVEGEAATGQHQGGHDLGGDEKSQDELTHGVSPRDPAGGVFKPPHIEDGG